MKGIGSEENYVYDDIANLQKFLCFNEDRKGKCEMTYDINKKSQVASSLSDIWGVDLEQQSGSYMRKITMLSITLLTL